MPAPALPRGRRRPRRPWKLVASCLALVVLVLINVNIASNRRYYDMLSAPTDGLARIHICESLGRVPEVLFMGSSRTLHGIDAPLMDRLLKQQLGRSVLTCNSGDFSSTFQHDYYMLKRYIEDGFVPKLIVENLLESNLTYVADYPGPVSIIPTADLPWLADASDVWDVTQHQSLLSDLGSYSGFLLQKLVPLYGDRIGVLKQACAVTKLAGKVGPCASDLGGTPLATVKENGYQLDQGYVPITDRTMVQTWPIESKQSPPCYPNCARLEINGNQVTYLSKLILLAHKHHIRVVLNFSPMSAQRFLYFAPGDWEHVDAYFQGVADLYGAYFSDASHLPGYTMLDFSDTHHLDQAGATKFTTWLASTIVTPILTGALYVSNY